MKTKYGKVLLVAMILAVLGTSVLFSAAGAEDGQMTYTEWKDRVLNLQRIMFKQHKNGIGLGDCPVYTAPSKKALRFANNRQAVDTEKELYEAGKTEDGWLLVRYDPGNGKIRTGYIPPDKVSGFKSGFSLKGKFDDIPVIAANRIEVTDDPITGQNIFATFSEGDSFALLAKYTYHGNWWYIECTVDGKTARGFIDRDKSLFRPGSNVEDSMNQAPVSLNSLGSPSISPMNTKQIGEIVINGNEGDARKNVHRDADTKSDSLTVVYPSRAYPYYATETGSDGDRWYYVFVEEDTMWGWVSGSAATPERINAPEKSRYENDNDEYFIYTIDVDGGAVLEEYGLLDLSSVPETVRIPSVLDGFPLRSIGSGAIFDCYETENGRTLFDEGTAKQLVLPEGLATLESYSLGYAYGFREIFLPASLTDIQEDFEGEGCTAVFHVSESNPRYASVNGFLIDKKENALIYAAPSSSEFPLPEVKVFKELSLHYYQPEQIVFPDSTEYIESFTCYDNIETMSVIIPGSVRTIADEAFYAMGVEEFVLREGIQHIGAYAFYDTEVKELAIPGSVKWLGFEFCKGNVKLSGQPAAGCHWETEEEYEQRMEELYMYEDD